VVDVVKRVQGWLRRQVWQLLQPVVVEVFVVVLVDIAVLVLVPKVVILASPTVPWLLLLADIPGMAFNPAIDRLTKLAGTWLKSV
jgi:hypothetical protein